MCSFQENIIRGFQIFGFLKTEEFQNSEIGLASLNIIVYKNWNDYLNKFNLKKIIEIFLKNGTIEE